MTFPIQPAMLTRWWRSWAAPVLLAAFVLATTTLAWLRHATFHTSLFDLGYYTQVIWNTAHGRWFVSSLKPGIFLADHFSPILLLLAPIFALFPDARVLLLVEMVALAVAIVPAYLILKPRYPNLAPLIVVAYVLNPSVHQIATKNFHEIFLAAPTLALAFYASYRRKTTLLLIALGLTLLVREDMGIYVALFGLYYALCRSSRRWFGILLIGMGVVWLLTLTGWVMPALGEGYYRHGGQFSRWGGSIPDVLAALIKDPSVLLRTLTAPEQIKTLLKVFLPLLFLPLLARGEQLLWLPAILLLLQSPNADASSLDSWYMVPLLPLIWGTIALVLVRVQIQWKHQGAKIGLGLLLAANISFFLLWSPFPGGGRFDVVPYTVQEHHRIGHRVVRRIPPDVSVAAQSGLGAHLATREKLSLFPWFSEENSPEMIVLDATGLNSYPLHYSEIEGIVDTYRMDPRMQVYWEQDGYIVFRTSEVAGTSPWRTVECMWDVGVRVEGYEIAQTDETGAFMQDSTSPAPGQTLRVELYLEALTPMDTNYSISVRAITPEGRLLAQDDSWPARGLMPTVVWPAGQLLRDTHYLTLPMENLPNSLLLQVVMYDSATLERVSPASGCVLTAWEDE
ncbi:MAG: DUF2079 domain-containing protein [Chloroflexi bacterium]|jgi:uncharacterized membrane protein|nr:DUF2079 domain-containing protein [Chloroflexota bacterium]